MASAWPVEPLKAFYEAEKYHQNYVKNNPFNPYILQEAMPKIKKAKEAASQPAANSQ
ncbi:MAG TPA: peptide-methionine (S)-S-oxide reductase [Tepidisphaeraceae bacterium]|nr:peptide-methionine (S)-S-oxide reductase [Tepidisphaeraceae bacterium]